MNIMLALYVIYICVLGIGLGIVDGARKAFGFPTNLYRQISSFEKTRQLSAGKILLYALNAPSIGIHVLAMLVVLTVFSAVISFVSWIVD